MGGLISGYAFAQYPQIFGKAACVSTHWPLVDPSDLGPFDAETAGLWKSFLRERLAWFNGQDLSDEIERRDITRYYAPISWHALLAGYGMVPEAKKLRPIGRPQHDMSRIDDFVSRCAMNFIDRKQALQILETD